MKILELVRDGKQTPEQGLELLDALEGAGSNRIVQEFVDLHSSTKPARNLKITTHSRKGNKMEFLIPLGVVRFAYNLFPNSTRINQQQTIGSPGCHGKEYKEKKLSFTKMTATTSLLNWCNNTALHIASK